ncbi:hypothetical protein [Clostridium cochlearium]|jgi:hypothetical protein|uniref:Putative PilT-like ATPase n=1 Tax=Clostridium cochlearium TaxID=1494 RepID=A0A240AY33_CLOCO|nr:hypothetical protein [Clostridium cochlearium]MBE6065190.1 hypothetical protein [Clostridium cochlearium]MBU5268565.1 hypothetical protein [Clostridium cochlearium]MCR1971020.1 hypothetical protein [Clostridium cochlearium]MDU1442716.1 hypothetical protein [Clostridium cochlearium]NMA57414.1 hypothetical protein [Clostridium cochlearium]
MIQVFCDQRGAGKSKKLIQMANEKAVDNKGHIVFIDDDRRAMFELHRNIRFISTSDFNLKSDYKSFYGFLCGMLSSNYDIDTIYIDGLFNIVNLDNEDAALLFFELEKLEEEYSLDIYINVNEENDIPDCMKKYTNLLCV